MLVRCIFPCLLLAASSAAAQEADEVKARCVAAHGDAQLLQKRAALLAARKELLTCSAPACPAILRNDCVQMLDRVEREIPTVVFDARTDGGAVRVSIDGEVVADRIDGRPVEIDPGSHTFEIQVEGRPAHRQTIVIVGGQKNRLVTASWIDTRPPPPPPPPRPIKERPIPVAVPILMGVGIAGLTGFGAFGLVGRLKKDDLASCAPFCAESEVDTVRTYYLAANVSLAVGVAALVGAAIGYVLRPERERP